MHPFFKTHYDKIIIALVLISAITVGIFSFSKQRGLKLTSSLVQNAGHTVFKTASQPKKTDELIIKIKESTGFRVASDNQTNIQSINKINTQFSIQSIESGQKNTQSGKQGSLTGIYKVKVKDSSQLDQILAEYKKNPNIEFVEPNETLRMTVTPNDSLFKEQWHLNNTGQSGGSADADIDATEAWDITKGSDDVTIAIVDTGVDTNHPDLTNKIIAGYNFVEENTNANPTPNGIDDDGDGIIDGGVEHGTHVASTAAAASNNNQGGTGVDWNAKIMPVKTLDDEGNGSFLDIANGIDWAVQQGADVINLSLGGGYSTTVDLAIKNAFNNGVVVVAAAGNDNLNLDVYKQSPVCNDGGDGNNHVIGVASVNDSDIKSGFSNYGTSCVDIAAPGEYILGSVFHDSTYGFTSYYANFSGTSMATPIVSGIASLIKAKNPTWTNVQIRNKIISSADNIDTKNPSFIGKIGSGRANAYNAVKTSTPTISAAGTRIITGPASGMRPRIQGYTPKGIPTATNFNAFASSFTGGTRVAFGDIDGDGEQEIIVGAGPGGGPQIRVFEKDGTLRGIQFFAFDPRFRGGINVAAGDVDGDGKDEITACQASKGQAWCKVYRYNVQKTVLGEWNSFGRAEVGASVAMGDVDRDGKAEIIVGAGPGGGPQVRVFEANGTPKPIQFMAFDQRSRSGISVASGDVNGDRRDDIGVCLGKGEEAWCKVYEYNTTKTILANFRAYPQGFTGGASIALGDPDGDGNPDIITAAGPGGGPQVRIFDATGKPRSTSFMALDPTFRGGIFIAVEK